MIGHLRFFFMSDENESVFIIGSKLYHVFCDDKKVQMGRSRSDAQLKMSTVSAQVPVILLFLTWSSTEFEEKSSGSNTFGFLSIKLELNLRISSCYFITYFIIPEGNCLVKTISISSDDEFSPLSR